MGKKKILMLLESVLHEDERVQKTCMSLSDAGFEVHIIFPAATVEVSFSYPDVYLYPFTASKYLLKKLYATCLIHPFYFMFWSFLVRKYIADLHSFSIIYAHDLPLIKPAYLLKKKYGLKLVSDQHEYFTEFVQHTPHMLSLIGKVLGAISRWDAYEKKYLKEADLVITVFEALQNRYAQRIPELKDKTVVLPNSPLRNYYRTRKRNTKIAEKYINKKAFRAIFVGAVITRERRLDLMIDAIPKIVKQIPNFRFMILGSLHGSYDLMGHIKRLGIESHIDFTGRVPNFDIPDYLHCAVLGINVHDTDVGQVVHETFFTKFYQYLGMHNAIITTELKAMASLVRQYEIGRVVESDPDSIADAVVELLSDSEVLNKCIQNIDKITDIFWEDTSVTWIEKMKML
jgi:glycosyltransferase involved in cell wall biosynthesis